MFILLYIFIEVKLTNHWTNLARSGLGNVTADTGVPSKNSPVMEGRKNQAVSCELSNC